MCAQVFELPGFRHTALFYDGDEEFLAGTLPLVREAVGRQAAVLVAVPRARGRVLRDALGADAATVGFADMEVLGRNPARIIPAWRDFVRDHAGGDRPPLGIGEPIWPERTEAELVECERHETLLNVAFAGSPEWRLVCPYDAGGLAPEVLERARGNHPHLAEHGATHRNADYRRAIPGDDPLPPPGAEPVELTFARSDLRLVREFLADRARRAGVTHQRLADLVLAVDELATNSLRYARGHGTLRTWQENSTLLC
ncbi:MAG: anti-sigma factor RsbA family regulatory protein, partial [Solirubrobacteraceae bacterium]